VQAKIEEEMPTVLPDERVKAVRLTDDMMTGWVNADLDDFAMRFLEVKRPDDRDVTFFRAIP
jgi:hypothetical protein